MCFGKWPELLSRYKYGLTQDLAFKLLAYIKKAIDQEGTNTGELLILRDKIKEWSGYYANL